MAIIIMDGTRTELQTQIDLNRDGKIDETETLMRQPNAHQNTTHITEPSELNEVIKELNADVLDDNNMSSIDLKSNLHPIEVPFILAFDALVSFKVFPKRSLIFTRQKKRLAVSEGALGRKNSVDIATGQREHEENKSGGMGSAFKKLMGGKKKDDG